MPRITKVTTKRGDDGKTDLADGRRVRKDSKRIQALGSLDELNSAIGWARSQNPGPSNRRRTAGDSERSAVRGRDARRQSA